MEVSKQRSRLLAEVLELGEGSNSQSCLLLARITGFTS